MTLGKPCTVVIRTLHRTFPYYWIWGLPFFLFYSTRSSRLLHERPNQGLLRAFSASYFLQWYKYNLKKIHQPPNHIIMYKTYYDCAKFIANCFLICAIQLQSITEAWHFKAWVLNITKWVTQN